ncbi:MAG TPA: alanyl-tRNA editing protein, partial [Acidobacteriota bacterium]|nr:alanyl-tRNA editing protein [Acidobacteriota bacterium]
MAETKKLYYEDAYLTEFDARVVERRDVEGRPAVVLDRTAFYPEAGGQSSDRGTLDGVAVVDVVDDGGTILHVLAVPIEAAAVHGAVDRARRFDRMQQHSGQHILSQAFYEVLKGATLSFHIGDEVSALEIGVPKISDADLDRVEARANAVVFEDLEIRTYFVPEEEIGTVPLRKPPKKGEAGMIRVVEVDRFDHSACGGTHCRRAGEVGLIKVVKWEKIRGNLRFDFVCGGRALRDYQEKNRTVRHAAAAFSVSDRDVPAAIDKAQAEVKALKKRARRLEERVAAFEAGQLVREASGKVIQAVFEDRSPEEARFLALNIIKQGEFVVLFAAPGEERSHIILAAAEALGLDART